MDNLSIFIHNSNTDQIGVYYALITHQVAFPSLLWSTWLNIAWEIAPEVHKQLIGALYFV